MTDSTTPGARIIFENDLQGEEERFHRRSSVRALFWALRHSTEGLRVLRILVLTPDHFVGWKRGKSPFVYRDVLVKEFSDLELEEQRAEVLLQVGLLLARDELEKVATRFANAVVHLPEVQVLLDDNQALLNELHQPLREFATKRESSALVSLFGDAKSPATVVLFRLPELPQFELLKQIFPVHPRLEAMAAWVGDATSTVSKGLYKALPEEDPGVSFDNMFAMLALFGWHGLQEPYRYGRRGGSIKNFAVKFGCHASASFEEVHDFFVSTGTTVLTVADLVQTAGAWNEARKQGDDLNESLWRRRGLGWPLDEAADSLRPLSGAAKVELLAQETVKATRDNEFSNNPDSWLFYLDSLRSPELFKALRNAGLTRGALSRLNVHRNRLYHFAEQRCQPLDFDCAPWPVSYNDVSSEDVAAALANSLHRTFPVRLGRYCFDIRDASIDDLSLSVDISSIGESFQLGTRRKVRIPFAPRDREFSVIQVLDFERRLIDLAEATDEEVEWLVTHWENGAPLSRLDPLPDELLTRLNAAVDGVRLDEFRRVLTHAGMGLDGRMYLVLDDIDEFDGGKLRRRDTMALAPPFDTLEQAVRPAYDEG